MVTANAAQLDATDECCRFVWGKNPDRAEPYPLLAHLLDTVVVFGWLWDNWLRPGLRQRVADVVAGSDVSKARRVGCLIAGLHDVGKANPVFQEQVASGSRFGTDVWRERLRPRLAGAGLPSVDDRVGTLVRGDVGRTDPVHRHEYVGFAALAGSSPTASTNVGEHWLATVVAGHHGSWWSKVHEGLLVAKVARGGWGEQQRAHVAAVESAVGLRVSDVSSLAGRPGVPVLLLSGLLNLADWLASDDVVVDAGEGLAAGLDPTADPAGWMSARAEFLCARAEALVTGVRSLADLRTHVLEGKQPRPLQEVVESVVGDEDGLLVVMYPTGEGKTDAALLRHASRDEGMIFALPTRATTDAMDARLSRVLERSGNPVYLAHGMVAAYQRDQARSNDEGTSEWFSSSVRRLVAPFVAATCDQVLMAGLRMKRSPLRLLAVANHHIVFDEVHTFDAYQMELLEELLAWLGATNTRVTLLSATLPSEKVTRLLAAYRAGSEGHAEPEPEDAAVAYPSYVHFNPTTGETRSSTAPEPLATQVAAIAVESRDVPNLAEGLEEWAFAVARSHPDASVAVVTNTVDDAIGIANTLASRGLTQEVWCLHSRMTMKHRTSIEQKLLARLGQDNKGDRGVIVIGTQVIEASLDIDFDFMASSLAPAPSLVQRAGRLWRFEDAARAARTGGSMRTLTVVSQIDGEVLTKTAPYPASMLQRVRGFLADHLTLRVPEDIQDFVETDRPATATEWAAAAAEVGADVTRVQAAQLAKAPLRELNSLAGHNQNGRRGRFQTSTRKSLEWKDLAALTDTPTDDHEALTRYIDSPSGSFLILDPSGTNPWALHADAGTVMNCKDPRRLVEFIQHTAPVSASWLSIMNAAAEATVDAAGIGDAPEGSGRWRPALKALQRFHPVNVAFLPADYAYDALVGLMRNP